MEFRVVSTKLSEEEHTKFLEFCNKKGISPFAAVKQAIEKSMEEELPDMSVDELKKELGLG